MEFLSDDSVLSSSPTVDENQLIEELVRRTPPPPAPGPRVLRVPILRRRVFQPTHPSRTSRDLLVPSPMNFHEVGELHFSDASTSSTLTFMTRTSRSSDPYSTSGFVEEEPMDEAISESEECEVLVEPKVESPDNDVLMDDLQAVEEINGGESSSTALCRPKRPRGRPRKHPVQSLETLAKVQKGRSKTGCRTCRRRKKKCDEAKPHCMNCEKNAVICEGYPDREYWRSGKERGREATVRRLSLPNITLAPIIHGVETPGDRIFFEHYCFRLSAVLTVEGPAKNAFKDMLLPMAIQHLGLMHSILALSSTNIDYQEPYGVALLAKHPDLNVKILQERAEYHQQEALKELNLDIKRQSEGLKTDGVLSVTYGQMLCLVVQSIAEGKATGEHRIHLNAYKSLIQESPPEEGPFMEFIEEYFQFHIGLDDLISLPEGPEGRERLGAVTDDWNLPAVIQPEAVRLLGVQDGLFFYMSKITAIRNTIRSNMEERLDPVVDYTSLYRAAEIDAGIREWHPSWPQDDARDLAGLLYKQMMWVYLWRTIYPPKTTTWAPEYKITSAVNDGLALLKLFPPKDPIQTLLLAPTFIIGCAAFDPAQRPAVRNSIRTIKEYTSLKNADRAMEVLEEVWRYMDEKDERSWDWQSIAHGMGMDFLAT